jgi:hypothetical protein
MKDRPVEQMIETIIALHKKYPDGRIPFEESPVLSSQVFLDLCERVTALEAALKAIMNQYADLLEERFQLLSDSTKDGI